MFGKPTLVIGATGKTGRRVAERLKARGQPVRAGSRAGQPPFDWADPGTWSAAVRDVAAVYVTYYPDLAAPGASDAIRSFTGLAVKSGVQRLVLLSGRGEPEAQLCEQIVRESGVEYTLLRASWFAQNFSEGFFLEPILAGEVALPIGNVGEPFIHTDDIADAALAALTEDRHAGQLYELTGHRLWTFAQAIAEIARVTNRNIRYVQISARLAARRGDPVRIEGVSNQADPDLALYETGALLPGPNAMLAGPTFEEWLDSTLNCPNNRFSERSAERPAAEPGRWAPVVDFDLFQTTKEWRLLSSTN